MRSNAGQCGLITIVSWGVFPATKLLLLFDSVCCSSVAEMKGWGWWKTDKLWEVYRDFGLKGTDVGRGGQPGFFSRLKMATNRCVTRQLEGHWVYSAFLSFCSLSLSHTLTHIWVLAFYPSSVIFVSLRVPQVLLSRHIIRLKWNTADMSCKQADEVFRVT